MTIKIVLANPRGFCAGVDRAIEIVERAIQTIGAPIYVRHEVVHNRFVVESLRAKGAVFVEELDAIPDGGTVIFSAHGVSQAVEEEARRRGLRVFDATCPLVTKVHLEVIRHARAAREVILIGHAGHPEVEGTVGRYSADAGGAIYVIGQPEEVAFLKVKDSENLAYVTQTTLSVDDTARVIEELRRAFPSIQGPKKNDICYATQSRQDAVKELARECDVVLVVGSPNSSNSNRLREVAQRRGVAAYLIDDETQIEPEWFSGVRRIGITAGASAPEILVARVIDRLRQLGVATVLESNGSPEAVSFPLPRELLGG